MDLFGYRHTLDKKTKILAKVITVLGKANMWKETEKLTFSQKKEQKIEKQQKQIFTMKKEQETQK